MSSAVFSFQTVSLAVTWGGCIIRALAYSFCLQGLEFPLELENNILRCLHGGVLGHRVVCLIWHFGCQVYVCVSEVSHCHPVLCRRLGEVCAHQVVGSVAALALMVFLPLTVTLPLVCLLWFLPSCLLLLVCPCGPLISWDVLLRRVRRSRESSSIWISVSFPSCNLRCWHSSWSDLLILTSGSWVPPGVGE